MMHHPWCKGGKRCRCNTTTVFPRNNRRKSLPSIPTEPFDNEMRGVLFVNENKRSAKSPNMTGKCQINGKEYRLAAWTQTSRKGDKFLSLSITDPDEQAATVATKEEQESVEELPF